MKFQGYFSGWDKCQGCGMKLVKVGDSLRHRSGFAKIHDIVVAKKAQR